MNIQLSPHIEGYIASKIASGAFADVSSFVSVAVAKFRLEEAKEAQNSEADEAWEEYQSSGEGVYNDEMLAWFDGIIAGKEIID